MPRFNLRNLRIGVVGLGYVGLPLAVEFGKRFETVGFDVKQARVDKLKAGHDSTLEATEQELAEAPRLSCTTRLEDLRPCKVFIEAILRCGKSPLARWGKKLLAAKGSVNLAVAAIARKLTVAVWYLMMGRWTALEEIDQRLLRKVSKMIGSVGQQGLQSLGKTRKAHRQEICQRLKTGRPYILDPNKKYVPRPAASPA